MFFGRICDTPLVGAIGRITVWIWFSSALWMSLALDEDFIREH